MLLGRSFGGKIEFQHTGTSNTFTLLHDCCVGSCYKADFGLFPPRRALHLLMGALLKNNDSKGAFQAFKLLVADKSKVPNANNYHLGIMAALLTTNSAPLALVGLN